jgi:DNA repair protein RadC
MVRIKMKKRQYRVGEDTAGYKHWRHPGGKLLSDGAEALSDAELLAMIISSGIPGKSAEEIAKELINKYGSFKGIANQPLEKFYSIRGLKKVKVMRIAAAFEIARRIVNQVMEAK